MRRRRAEPHAVQEALIGPAELAAYLGVSVRTIYDWRYLGVGPPGYRVGRHVRYRPVDVTHWLETRRDQPRADSSATPAS